LHRLHVLAAQTVDRAKACLFRTCIASQAPTAQAIAHGGPQLQILAPNNIDISFQEFQNCSEVGHLLLRFETLLQNSVHAL